ncbi:MAG: DUF4003 domain-containing protein [Clostridia bacterium]|nr:DUF4003 domain-containing protein [Clostridia bacterium]
MNSDVQKAAALYCENYLRLKKPLYWKTSTLYVKLCALAYAFEGSHADPDALLQAISYIKENTGAFSYLRSSRVYSAAYLTATRKSIDTEFSRLSHCYDVMKRAGFGSSNYLPIAAYALYSTTSVGLELSKAETAKLVYEAMKKQHPFLTTSDDYASAVILASSDRAIAELLTDAESTYQLLKSGGFYTSNGLQFLSQILVFDTSSPEEKAQRCLDIAQRLKEYKNKISSMYYGTIGFLALCGNGWEEAIEEVLDVIEYLKEQKCHGLGEREFNLMIASAFVCKCRLTQSGSPSAFLRVGIGTTVEAILAAQAAACAAAAGAAAAASAST